MNAHTAGSSLRSVAIALITAVGLFGLTGCDNTLPPPPSDFELDPSAVFQESRVTLVEAGTLIRVVVHTPAIADAEAWFRASVSWDASSFEYLGCDPLRPEARITQDMTEGWMSLEDATFAYLPKREIIFVFRALVDANTSGFAVHVEDSSTATDDPPIDR